MNTTLLYNGYQPYGDYNSDILNIIETEKNVNEDRIKQFNKRRKQLLPKDLSVESMNEYLNVVNENITHVLYESFKDIFEKKSYKSLVNKDRLQGIGYLLIIIYLIYFISTI